MTWKRLGAQIVGQATADEVIVTDLENGVYHSISGAGAVIWENIDRGCSREQIVQMLDSAYEASPETLNQAFTEFVDRLVGYDLIKPSEESGLASEARYKSQPSEKIAFTPPTIVKFRNTDSLLAEKSARIRWQPSVQCIVSDRTPDEAIIVNAQKRVSYKITGTGVLIWKCISLAQTRENIVNAVSAHYDATNDVISSEIDQFVIKLAGLGLIQPVDGESSKLGAPEYVSETKKKTWASPAVAVDGKGNAALRVITECTGWHCATPRVVAESIDNEVIAVDLQAGVYHTITGAGTIIWKALNDGYTREQIIQQLLSHYDTTAATVEQEVDDLIGKLVDYDLIRAGQQISPAPNVASAEPKTKERFAPSEVVVYRDMEDVLKLDPVHDFEEYGWPNKVPTV